MPINHLSCLQVVSAMICSIASAFFCDGQRLSLLVLLPRYSRFVCAKKLFTALIFRPASCVTVLKQAQVFLGVFQTLFLLIKSRDHRDMPEQILAQT
jgi:hypothetical protein